MRTDLWEYSDRYDWMRTDPPTNEYKEKVNWMRTDPTNEYKEKASFPHFLQITNLI
jgi:hypothetical protein